MAYVGLTNVTIAQGGAADFLYATYAALTSASWVTLGSGTGAAGGFSSSGSLITSAATFNSAGAWARMREPGGVGAREYIFQRTAATTGIIKYSRSDGFVSGSPAAAVAPTTGGSGDGQVIVGTGADASPTAATLCGASGYVQAIASTTATNGTYGFWTFQYAAATAVLGGIFCTEGVAVGSTADTDGDPSWRLRATDSNFWNSNGAAISWWNKYNLAGESYITGGQFATFTLSNGAFSPQFYYISGPGPVGQDPYGGKTGFYPLMVGKNGVYPKGYTSGISQGTTLQNLLDVFNISSSEPRITVNIGTVSALALFVIPWVPNIIPSV